MASRKQHRRQTERRLDVVKIQIEDVNLTAKPFPVAQGRDIHQYGLFDIDLSHGVGGRFPTPSVGQIWWIKRSIGKRWILDHIVDSDRESVDGSDGGGGGDSNRSDVPENVVLGFSVREKKTNLEYHAFMTFDAVTEDENGNAASPEHYVIDWVPCTKEGNIITDEKVRQHIWSPNDAEIDEPDDPSADYYAVLPGNVPRPKVWWWKGRVRAVSTGGAKGEWSDWTEPVLPFRVALPEPPAPDNIDLRFRIRETKQDTEWRAIVEFDDVNYWDIPGFDYEDDVTEYTIQLQPLQRRDQYIVDIDPENQEIDLDILDYPEGTLNGGDGHFYVQADPNNDGVPWPVKRQNVKDKDAEDTYVTLGTMAEEITEIDTTFDVDEATADGTPSVPFIVKTNQGEKWLVTSRTLVGGSVYTYEVYRQFDNSLFQIHLSAETLTWLKDPFVYHVQFDHVERPKTIYWRTRVRSKDRFNRLGPWSDYTLPELPWSSIDFNVPVPEDLRADIEIHSYKTHPRYKLVARFKDPAPHGWNIPGGDPQDDLSHYIVQGEAILPDPEGYIEGRDGQFYRIPDRKIGVLQAQMDQADTDISITLDADLPPSIMKLLNHVDDRKVFLRVQTGSALNDQEGNEVVATTAQTSSGSPRVYTVERMQKGTFDHGHNVGDFVYLLTEHLKRAVVHDKDESDRGHFNERYTADLGQISHEGRFFWRVRARSVDNFNHKGAWTEYTNPISPATDPDLIIDTPDYVALSFDRVHRDRWIRHRAIVEWAEVDYTAPDGDREADVSKYGIQLANTDGDELDVEITDSQLFLSVLEKRQSPAPPPFFIMIDDESMKVTDRVQVVDTQYTYTIERAQKGTIAAAHVQGSRLYQYPFAHHMVSAKQDDDANNFNRVAFPRAQKFRHYKARVRVFDRYNRVSNWSAWTPEGTPSDHVAPHRPTNVEADIDNHKIVVNWDYPTDVDDTDPDLPGPSDESAYFQVQLSKFSDYKPLIKFDRYVAATHKTFRVKKPGNGTFYIRVRAVDGSGNKSAWVETSGAQNGVPTPNAPVITFDVNEQTKRIRALVLLEVGVTHLDDDIDGYEFELQPAEFRRTTEPISLHETLISVTGARDMDDLFDAHGAFPAYMQKEEVRVTHVNNNTDTVTVIRGRNSTAVATHREKVRFQYFRGGTKKRRHRTGEESEIDDPILWIAGNIERGLWYRARVRAKNTKGLWGNWSEWS